MVYVKLKNLAQELNNKPFEVSQEMYDRLKEHYLLAEKQETKSKEKKISSRKKSK